MPCGGKLFEDDDEVAYASAMTSPDSPSKPCNSANGSTKYYSVQDEIYEDDGDDEEQPFNPDDMVHLGSGGFGSVYYVKRLSDGLPMALKVTQSDPEDIDSDDAWDAFYVELKFYEGMCSGGSATMATTSTTMTTATAKYPSWLPKFYGSGTLDGSPWISMEYLGPSFHGLNKIGVAVPLFRHLAIGAVTALEQFHSKGFIHRDIKPDNFVVRTAKGPPGSLPEVVLIDFGLVTTFRKDAPGSDDEEEDYMPFWGTYEFASERQLEQRILGPADDLESLGYALLELYVGHSWRKVLEKPKNQKLKQFAEENQHLVLPSRCRRHNNNNNKRDREPSAAQAQLKIIDHSANPRERQQPRHEEKKGKDAVATTTSGDKKAPSIVQVEMVLAAAALHVKHTQSDDDDGLLLPVNIAALPVDAAVAASAAAHHGLAVAAAAGTADVDVPVKVMTMSEKLEETVLLRTAAWELMMKQGKIPDFIQDWMKYCTSLSAYDHPNYNFLRSLLRSPLPAAASQRNAAEAAEE